MRKLTAIVIAAILAFALAPAAIAADLPEYPTYDIPDLPPVDYGLGGSFYLRGSVAGNAWWASDANYCGCAVTFDAPGYGYSIGAGVGYETGDGFRADLTYDYLSINGLTATTNNTVNLRSSLFLANAYYDFKFDDYGSANGGFGAYVGAGVGFGYNYSEVMSPADVRLAWGTSVEAAGAVMAGVTYDMGTVVADLGYRGIYMNKVMSQPPAAPPPYLINNNWIHEVRGTLRYRFQ